MGCDIHTVAQRREGDRWIDLGFAPFDYRSYGMFGFLANVRNYSAVTPISEPRGLPEDFDDEAHGFDSNHSCSWLAVQELTEVDYDQVIEDRRCAVKLADKVTSYGGTCEAGKGERVTLKIFLGEAFFRDLAMLQELGAERVVFSFDS